MIKPKVISAEEAERAAFVVCVRVDQQPPEPDPADKSPWAEWQRKVRSRSTIEQCQGCGADIIVDSESPKSLPRICIPCCSDIMAQQQGETDDKPN